MGISEAPEGRAFSINDALFPLVRQRVLALFFGRAERSFYANEVIALVQSGSGAVQRELVAMSEAGLLTVTRVGNQRHYQANPACPVFAELRGLVLKTSGLADVLREALAPLAAQISGAFVYGSMAKQSAASSSDVDVMIVSEALSYAQVFGALEGAAAKLTRAVNPTLYTPEEFARRVAQDRAFITRVLAQPKIWLLGSEQALGLQGVEAAQEG
jgi:predicted nucleotidyltransferase